MSEVLNQENGSFSRNWRNIVLIEWREARCRRAAVKNRTGKLAEKERKVGKDAGKKRPRDLLKVGGIL